MKSDAERGKFGTWAYRARRAKYGSAEKAAIAITAAGYQVDGTYLRGIEAGHHKPGADLLVAMETAYGSNAPPHALESTETPADLVAALVRHTAAMEAQTAARASLSVGSLRWPVRRWHRVWRRLFESETPERRNPSGSRDGAAELRFDGFDDQRIDRCRHSTSPG